MTRAHIRGAAPGPPAHRARAIRREGPSSPHGRRRRRIPDQGQDHQQVPGRRLSRPVELRARARPAGEGRLGPARGRFPDHLRAARRSEAADQRDRERAQGCSAPLSRDRPGPRGRGDLLASAGGAQGARRDQRRRRQARGVPRDHQGCRARGDAPSARPRRRPDRRLPGAPRARLSGRLHPFSGALAQAPGLSLGRPRAVGGAAPDLRARERDRGVSAARVLDHRGRVRERPRVPGSRPASPASTARSSENSISRARRMRSARSA